MKEETAKKIANQLERIADVLKEVTQWDGGITRLGIVTKDEKD